MAVVRVRPPRLALQPEPPAKDPRPPPPPPPPPAAAGDHRLADLEKVHVVGHGNGGTVYKVRHVGTGAVHALKLLRPHHHSDPATRRQIYREIEILRRTDSPYVVRCHGILHVGAAAGEFALLMEYMDGGSLAALLRRRRRLPEAALAEVARHVLHGLGYLHTCKIVHRDIKPANLLLNRAGEVKIADFGVAKVMARSLAPCDSYVGTCAYMSPERLDPGSHGGSYDGYAGDVWSLGLTVLELYLGRFPLLREGESPDWAALVCAVCLGDLPRVPEAASPEFSSFVACCLERDAAKRWSVERLLSHPFLSRFSRAESSAALLNLIPEHLP
ncbi:mitogen-activated protein kinase kinase 9-like [Wolffia australiana]